MKKILVLLLVFICCLAPVFGGNNTTHIDNPTMFYSDADTVVALESGDSNISFSDGYKGYCSEWGEYSAEVGDVFYLHDFVIINKETGEDTSNYIKTFFVYFYNDTQRNPILTQHMIWKFTDNKEFSQFRANKDLYYAILDKSTMVNVPNTGVLQTGNDTGMFFDFKLLKARFVEFQDYIGFNIQFKNLTDVPVENSTNITVPVINQTINNSSVNVNSTVNCTTLVDDEDYDYGSSNLLSVILDSHRTGFSMVWLFVCVLFLLILIFLGNLERK